MMKEVALSEFFPLPEGENQYPLEFIEANQSIKLKEDTEWVHVGLCEQDNLHLMETLISFHSKEVQFYKIQKNDLSIYLGKLFSTSTDSSAMGDNKEKILLDKLANDAPIVNLVNSIILEAISKGSSDIHIESFSEKFVVRYRIDGVLHRVGEYDLQKFNGVSSRIKIMSNLNIMEKRLPQDGRISVNFGSEEVDLRVSIVPSSGGESIVLRLFNKKDAPLTFEQLGFSQENRAIIDTVCKFPHGLFLITGPTGSGKTTTLSAILRQLNSSKEKIISIEDPVENIIEGINQIQTNEKIGLTFSSILKRVLRQDPNIIMVGEIRDKETAELSVRAALTGHLVISTLHTNDSIASIQRLSNMGIEPYLIASVLRGSAAQRLVRRLCPHCKVAVEPGKKELKFLETAGYSAIHSVYRSVGCPLCGGTGYKGRVALFEGFVVEEEFENLIAISSKYSDMKKYQAENKMKFLIQDGIEKMSQGITTIEEIERVAF